MPVAPYPILKVSVAGGGAQTGGVTATSGQSLQFSFDATAALGARSYKVVLYDFPEGFAQPAGWSTASDGTYFYSGSTPPSFNAPTLPLWGKVMAMGIINDGDPGISGNSPEDMIDKRTAVQTLSSNGLEDVAFGEEGQFSTGDDIQRKWMGAFKRLIRSIDDAL